ncbi:MAG: GHMP family kinase ATP-binding protein [Isosphaeraceae bacterium]
MNGPPWYGEAPGRLDVMGGVADYSGALVLQMPIRATTRVTITPRTAPGLEFASDLEGTVSLRWPEEPISPTGDVGALRGWLDEHRVPHWVRYPLGCLLLFAQAHDWRPEGGLTFAITSDVPASMGVSSSAALEVATLRALEAASGRRFVGTELARLAQRAENEIVGAPCGLMDQLAAAHGMPGALLPILCRPDVLSDPVPLPPNAIAVGWPSGVKHAVTGSPYATARTASFMGKKILEGLLKRSLAHLAELAPSIVHSAAEDVLPDSLAGAEFLARHGAVEDSLSTIDPARNYPVRAAAAFPVEESFRCGLAVQLLRGVADGDRREALEAVGELMYQAHAGYGSIGLGCPETDAMVEAIRELGPRQGFFGARVSGGGSGGTVVVLLESAALPELTRLSRTLTFGGAAPAPLIV